jgi:hypothetical protein
MVPNCETTYLDTRYFSAFPLQRIQSGRAECDIVTLLAGLQEWKVGILPITWQATVAAPLGATSRVDEASQTVHRSFACKRLSAGHKEPSVRNQSLRMILNEIAILSLPGVREHTSIIELEGVCWDVESDGQVWPVLVFDKTHWGDLSEFMNRPEGLTLSESSRWSLCLNIGEALFFMHEQGTWFLCTTQARAQASKS